MDWVKWIKKVKEKEPIKKSITPFLGKNFCKDDIWIEVTYSESGKER